MKKILLFVTALCLSALASGQPLYERYKAVLTEPRSYDCFRTVDPIRIDGKLKEDSWLRARPTEAFVDIRGEGYPEPCKETTVRMLWDDNYLYIAATLMEDNIVAKLTQRDTIIYHDNDFEVFLDPRTMQGESSSTLPLTSLTAAEGRSSFRGTAKAFSSQ